MRTKDWTGNNKSVFTTLGASNHTDKEREEYDFYATDPKAIDVLLSVENFDGSIWENACGNLHLSNRLKEFGYKVISTDIMQRKIPIDKEINFLYCNERLGDNIITNPPYKYASEWVYYSLRLLEEGKKLALFLKLQFLEGKARKKLFELYPPKIIYVFSERVICCQNGDFEKYTSSAIAYAWYVWEKGYTGDTIIKWVN